MSHLPCSEPDIGTTGRCFPISAKALVPQGISQYTLLCDNAKNVSGFGGFGPTPWHFKQHQATLVEPPTTGGRASKTRVLGMLFLRLSAGTATRGAGWQSVCRLWRAVRGGLVPAGLSLARFSSHASSATECGSRFYLTERSLQ